MSLRVPIIEAPPPKTEFYPKVQTQPRLGGEGSGAPPCYYIATGQAGQAVIGIDLGSRLARAATFKNGCLKALTEPALPCSLVVRSDGKVYTVTDPKSLLDNDMVYCMRALIGSDWRVEGPDFSHDVEILYTRLLCTLKDHAQSQTENKITKAVITVPASFTCTQRNMVREMAQAASLEVLQLINEPTAAALYHCTQVGSGEGTYLIYSLGAGTFAACVLVYRNGIVEVKSTSADSQLGCDNFDYALAQWVLERFQTRKNVTVSRDASTMERLRQAAEAARLDLSMSARANLSLAGIHTMGSGFNKFVSAGSLRLEDCVLRYEYAQIIAPIMELMMKHVQTVLDESHLTIDELDYVLPVGISTNTPSVKDFLRETFEGKVLPTANEMSAAMGAALHACLLVNELRDFVVWDALTLPISVQLSDGSCKTIVRRGTPLPITGYYQIDSVDATINLNVLQGDSEKAQENALLAELTINNCPPTGAVNDKVEVSFHVRADGTIEYSAQHIGLAVNLPVSVRMGERPVYVNRRWLTQAPPTHRKQDPKRLARLARKLNLSADVRKVYATLRQLGYDSISIADGTAVEKMIRALRRTKRKFDRP